MNARSLMRVLVVLTALLCLGTAGYAGQVWWARHIAQTWPFMHGRNPTYGWSWNHDYRRHIDRWKTCPFYGGITHYQRGQEHWTWWVPRRYYHEALILDTGVDVGDNPEAWEEWVKTRPDRPMADTP